MKHPYITLIAAACASFTATAATPALLYGEGQSVLLSEVISIKFDAEDFLILCADGTTVRQPLQPLTLGTSALQSVHTLRGEAAAAPLFDIWGRPVSPSATGLVIGRSGIAWQGQDMPARQAAAQAHTAAVNDALSYGTRAVAAAPALSIVLPGLDAQLPLSAIDSLSFDLTASQLLVAHTGQISALSLSDVTALTFPAAQTAVTIDYDGSQVSGTNPYYFQGVSIEAQDAHVVVRASGMTSEVEYILSGTSADGSFKVYSDYKWQATLQDLTLTNPSGPALNSQSGKKGTVKSPKGTVNTLCDGAKYASSKEDQKGCIFSEGQLIFNGKGTLNVASLNKHAICSDDYVSFDNGTVIVTTAASDAVHAKDSVIVQSGTITLTPSADGIDCDGPVFIRKGENGAPRLTITTTGDGVKGIKAGAEFLMTDGTVLITQTGKSAVKGTDTDRVIGIKAVGDLTITGGKVTIANTATDGRSLSSDGIITTQGAELDLTPALH